MKHQCNEAFQAVFLVGVQAVGANLPLVLYFPQATKPEHMQEDCGIVSLAHSSNPTE